MDSTRRHVVGDVGGAGNTGGASEGSDPTPTAQIIADSIASGISLALQKSKEANHSHTKQLIEETTKIMQRTMIDMTDALTTAQQQAVQNIQKAQANWSQANVSANLSQTIS